MPAPIDYPSPHRISPRWLRLRIGLLIMAALVSALVACSSGLRALDSLRHAHAGARASCATCTEEIDRGIRSERALFTNLLAVGAFASGAALVCGIGAIRAWNARGDMTPAQMNVSAGSPPPPSPLHS